MFMMSNVLSCRPPDGKLDHQPYEHQAIAHCNVHRERVIQDFIQRCKGNPNVKQPVILAMGGTAFRTLTGISGKKQGVSHMRGYPFMTPAGLVIPTFDPAFVSRTRKTIGVLIHDLMRAVLIAKHGFRPRERKYTTAPTEDQIRDFKARVLDNPDQRVAVDIETAMISNVRGEWPDWHSIQFALAPGEGIYFDVAEQDGFGVPGRDLNLDILNGVITPILASANPKVGHNIWRFDNRVLREKYKLQINGRVDDTMWMFHHWEPDLTIESTKEDGGGDRSSLSTRAGLQFAASFFGMDFAWKHLNESDPRFYGIADVDACQRIMSVLPEWMKQRKVWSGYDRYCREFDPYLLEMSARGIPINNEGRLELHDILQGERKTIDADLQANYPEMLMSCDPKVGLANEPKWFVATSLGEPRREDEKYRRVEPGDLAGAGIVDNQGAIEEAAKVPVASAAAEHYYFDDDPFWDQAEEKDDFLADRADNFDALNSNTRVTPEEVADKALAGADDDDSEINRLTPVKGVWRKMVKRTFDVEIAEIKKCECLVFVANVGKKGQPLKSGKTMTANSAAILRGEAPGAACPLCLESGKYREAPRHERLERWARLKPFKASKDQLIRYIKHKGWKVPFNRKLKKETTAAKEIDRLQKKTGDKLLADVLVARAVEKVDSTYVMGWAPWTTDGRIHAEFGFGPATGQLNSKKPNAQNAPKHVRYERLKKLNLPVRFRKLIEARLGHRIVELDARSFHILTLGYAARDPLYMKMARNDMHTFFSSHILTQMGVLKAPIDATLPEKELAEATGWLKKQTFIKLAGIWEPATKDQIAAYGVQRPAGAELLVVKDLRDQRAKPAILGKGLAMSANRLYTENIEYFTGPEQADFIMAAYDRTFPKEIEFQKAIAMLAHKQKYLVSQHGFLRRFWDVFSFKYLGPKEWETRHGEDYEDAISFLVQNPAHCHLRDTIFWLQEDGDWLNRCNFMNTIHDSLIFEIPDDIYDEALPAMKAICERKSKVLIDPVVAPDGLWCEFEVMASASGGNWAPYDKVDNPGGMVEVKI
jgi:DNA polymerase I-like protein with 3'-5' exonuclease and polymerase domains